MPKLFKQIFIYYITLDIFMQPSRALFSALHKKRALKLFPFLDISCMTDYNNFRRKMEEIV